MHDHHKHKYIDRWEMLDRMLGRVHVGSAACGVGCMWGRLHVGSAACGVGVYRI